MKKLIVFTDLDGSLLDHDNYSWLAAKPALDKLKKLSCPIIFNSSKTYSEMLSLALDCQIKSPLICENGSVVAMNMKCDDKDDTVHDNYKLHYFSRPYADLVDKVYSLKTELKLNFTGFYKMTLEQVMEATGLSKEKAMAASQRSATEPLLWQDSQEKLQQFEQQLKKINLVLTQGGRFYHVMSPVNKGEAMRWLLKCYRSREPDTRWVSMALGDSQNDVSMLEQADYPVLIKNPHTQQPDVNHIDKIIKTRHTGPAGWNEAVQTVLKYINQE